MSKGLLDYVGADKKHKAELEAYIKDHHDITSVKDQIMAFVYWHEFGRRKRVKK